MNRAPLRILLVNPWITDFAAYDFWIKPVGLLRIGRMLKAAGCDVKLLDCLDRYHPVFTDQSAVETRNDGTGHFHKTPIEKPECLGFVPRNYSRYGLPIEMAEAILADMQQPDLIFVTSVMTYWYPGVREMIGLLNRLFQETPVILGGIYATLCRDHAWIHSGADEIVAGEVDAERLSDILDTWTGRSPEIPECSPFPDYSFYPNLHTAALQTSKGCPFDCPFCASAILTDEHYRIPPDLVIGEVRKLHERGARHFAFYDDALLIQADTHLIPMLEGIVRMGLPIRFHTPNGMHPKLITPQIAGLFFKARFQTVRLSFETSNPERQKSMGMKVETPDLESAVTFLSEAGYRPVDIGCYVLMGLYDQPVEEVIESIFAVWRLGMRVSLASFSPIPGTACWKDAVVHHNMDPGIDPLLTNNSVFAMSQRILDYETFQRLHTLANDGNRLIREGVEPEHHQGIVAVMQRMLKHIA